jgi:hypothetical protein
LEHLPKFHAAIIRLGQARPVARQAHASLNGRAGSCDKPSPLVAVTFAMDPVFIEAFAVGFVGAILFLAVEMFERNSLLANLLKALLLIVGGMAILHKLAPPVLGLALF